MPLYRVKVKTREGEVKTETFQASNYTDLLQTLDSQGLFIISDPELVDETRQQGASFSLKRLINKRQKFRLDDLINILVSFTVLLESGLIITNALEEAAQGTENRRLASVFRELKEQVESGSSFGQAVENFSPSVFDQEFVAMIKVGEMTGNLTKVLRVQIKKLEVDNRIRKELKKQSIYPSILMSIVLILFFVITLYFMPKMTESFKSVIPEKDLPPKTRMILKINGAIVDYGWLLPLGLTFGVVFFKASNLFPYTKALKDTMLWKTPGVGKAIRFMHTAKLCQILNTGLSSGLSISECLASMQKAATNEVFRQEMGRVRLAVDSGASLGHSLDPQKTDSLFVSLVRAGEVSGKLAEILGEVAIDYYFETGKALMESILTYATYLVIVVLGVVVGYTIFSVIYPLYELPTILN